MIDAALIDRKWRDRKGSERLKTQRTGRRANAQQHPNPVTRDEDEETKKHEKDKNTKKITLILIQHASSGANDLQHIHHTKAREAACSQSKHKSVMQFD